MVIDGTDPFAAAKPDARLIRLLLRARRFNATLAEQRRHPLCCTRPAGRCQPVVFHAARPPQLSRAGYHPGDPRWAAAARFDGREAPCALTSAACLARSADRARLWLSPIRIQRQRSSLSTRVCRLPGTSKSCSALVEPDTNSKIYRTFSPEKARLCWDQRGILVDAISGTAVLEYGPTEILPPVGAISKHPARLCRPGRQASRAHPRGKPGFSTFESGCGRETDSLLEGDGFEPSVPGAREPV